MKPSEEFENLFSKLEARAAQELVNEERMHLQELWIELEAAQLDWVKLQVRLKVFGPNALTSQEIEALRVNEIPTIQSAIEQARERLAKLEAYLMGVPDG